jgi:tRNA/tmRNA/rRNA uracil-C5-methylase (TrmA/RlmC/RlmD family)
LEKLAPRPKGDLLCIFDPPRVGLGKDGGRYLDALDRFAPAKIIHIGCDPDSFAKDVMKIRVAGYRCHAIFALDLFPQTHHVESIAIFEKIET